MIRIKIEYTPPSPRYRLFRLRGIMILVAILNLIFHSITAAFFSRRAPRGIWITLAVFASLSMLTSIYDLSIHVKGKNISRPSTPRFYRDNSPPRRVVDEPTPRPSEDAGDYEQVEPQAESSRGIEITVGNVTIGKSVSTPQQQQTTLEERTSFFPPPPSVSEKSDSSTSSHDSQPTPFEPSTPVTFADITIGLVLFILYLANVIVESVIGRSYWYYQSHHGYGMKVHAIILTLILMTLHLRCFALEAQALRKAGSGGDHMAPLLPRARRGVLTI